MNTILQIIPCTIEFYARYRQDDMEFQSRVICLALIEEEDGYRKVVGMDWCEEEISSVESNSNFIGYADNFTPMFNWKQPPSAPSQAPPATP